MTVRGAVPARPSFLDVIARPAIVAAISLVLTLPIIGIGTVAGQNGLDLQLHLALIGAIAMAVFVGQLAFLWLRRSSRIPLQFLKALLEKRVQGLGVQARVVFTVILVAIIILPFVSSGYVIDLATTVLIYVMLGWGLNIVVGLAGLLDLGYVAFYGIGAYTVGLLSQNFGFGFWICLPLAGLFAAGFGILLGFPVLRLRGDYLAIVTLGFGEIIRIVLTNWQSLTNGPNGIGSIPRPSFFGLVFSAFAPPGKTTFASFFHIDFSPRQRLIYLYFLILALALVTNFFTLRLRKLPIGRAWEALREDEIACRALGLDPTMIKLSAFAIGAMFAGFAGAFFAARQGFISPESFTFNESAIILAIVVLGGMGSQIGIVLAAALLVILPELARGFAEYRMLLFGLAMIVIMVVRPRGLISQRQPSILCPIASASDPVMPGGASP